jgi:hypothetical protein
VKVYNLHTCGPRTQAPKGSLVVNTTSRSNDFGRAFSPFLNQGWIELGGLRSHNVENLWQFTKVYDEHLGNFTEWWQWRNAGLNDRFAHRYPMGKGRSPEYSFWGKKKLGYIEARKHIYTPAYEQKLRKYCQREVNTLIDMLSITDVWLWDFDGYTTDEPWKVIANDSDKKMGHAFVLKREVYSQMNKEW